MNPSSTGICGIEILAATVNHSQTADAPLPWYAIRVRSKHEHVAATAAIGKGFETLLPTFKARRQWTDRVKEIQLPLFPGYLFCRFDCQERLPILTIPGVVNIVSFGKEVVAVAEAEIRAMRSILNSGLGAEPWPFLGVGRKVFIEGGPLRGVEGIVTETKQKSILVVSVSLLQRSVAVAIQREWIRPL